MAVAVTASVATGDELDDATSVTEAVIAAVGSEETLELELDADMEAEAGAVGTAETLSESADVAEAVIDEDAESVMLTL